MTTKQFLEATKTPDIDTEDTMADLNSTYMINMLMGPIMPVIYVAGSFKILSLVLKNWVFGKYQTT